MPNETPLSAWVIQNVTGRSASPEGGQDLLAEEPDVLHGQRVGHRAELEQTDQHPDAELARLGLDLADDVVGVPDDRQALFLTQIEVELVEREVFGALDTGGPRRRRLSHERKRAAVIAQELLPEVVEVRLGLLTRPRVGLGDVDVPDEMAMLGPGGPPVLLR